MSTPRDMPSRKRPGGLAGGRVPGGQRFGRVTDRKPSGSGPGGRLGVYFVLDDESGTTYSFTYADIVTEGFRTIRTGERVRFLANPAEPGHASYVIRLDLPDIDEYYA
jgi:hypothetical protein